MGGFEAGQITHAMVAGFNMWNYGMTEEELESIGCGDKGNVVKDTDMKLAGAGAQFTTETFTCGNFD